MKHITLLAPEGKNSLSTIACIAGTYEIFREANSYWKKIGKRELFTIQVAGISNEVEFYNGLFTVRPECNISTIAKTDLIIIPSMKHKDQNAMKGNQVLIDWMKQQYKDGAEIASMCSGAFLLASSGLLDGKNCSTHWAHTDTFRTLFPNVNLQADQLITDENGIYTNGGAYSFLNLVIYLVEKYYDRQTAIYCSKIFQIEMDRNSQSAFTIFTGQKLHGDEMVIKAQAYIESKPDEKISSNLSAKKVFQKRLLAGKTARR